MSKYSNFAKNLDAAFKTARDEYAAVYAKYEQAERAAMDAQHRAPDDTAISYELRKAKAEAARVEQKAAFDEVCKRVWPDFNRKRAELRADLEKAIAADSIVDPAALDNNAVYLMDSGTMTAADYVAFAEKYSGNHTMLMPSGVIWHRSRFEMLLAPPHAATTVKPVMYPCACRFSII